MREPIGVFDSGLGGLTVLRALVDLLPEEDFLYFGDTGRFPYGSKPTEELLKHSIEIADLLLDRGVSLLVVACNSASAAALGALRARCPVPVLGVVEPGLRAAARVTESGRVGVIGTVGTIGSGAYEEAAGRFCAETGTALELTGVACPGFVELVEAGEVRSERVRALVAEQVAPLRDAGVDTLVLGCTHYPLLGRTIGDVMGPDVMLVSSADELAFDAYDLLRPAPPAGAGRPTAAPRRGEGARHFVTSGSGETFRELGARFFGPEVRSVEVWSWT